MACKLKSKAGTSSGSPPKSKNQRQTKKVRVEGEVATSVEKATSPPKSKKTRQTKKERVEEEVATSVEKAASPTKLKKPRQTNKARVEEEVATSVENAASPPGKPVTQEEYAADEDGGESRIIDKPMEDEEAPKQYPKRYVGEGETKEEPYICKIVEMFEAIIFYCPMVDQDVKSNQFRCAITIATPSICCRILLSSICQQSGSEDSTISVEDDVCLDSEVDSKLSNGVCAKSEVRLLDLYSGCGAMSTGLCLAAHLANVNLVTVRNEAAEDFLKMLNERRNI